MNIVVILAAGSGTRLGGDTPKQFLTVCGKTIIQHTIEAFHSHPDIDEMVIVTRADHIDYVCELCSNYPKVVHIVIGGKERYHSTLAALNLYTNDEDNLLFHDCVRPLVSHAVISRCIEALKLYRAVGVAVPSTDTILQVDSRGFIVGIPPRPTLRNAQTPQAFRRQIIQEAYYLALKDPAMQATDDCGIVHRYLPDEPIFIVDGENTNIKVTYREDLDFVEKYLKKSAATDGCSR